MTVYCDDSGWGSLLGGVAIGLFNDDTDKFLYRIIPIKYFQGLEYRKQTYLEEALDAFVKMESHIGSYKKIVVCRGFILDRIFDHLEEFAKTKYTREEIGDPLQGLLEYAYAEHLESLGVPCKSGGAHCLSFEDQLRWVQKDPTRIKYVKTGWPSWTKHSKTIKSKRKKKCRL